MKEGLHRQALRRQIKLYQVIADHGPITKRQLHRHVKNLFVQDLHALVRKGCAECRNHSHYIVTGPPPKPRPSKYADAVWLLSQKSCTSAEMSDKLRINKDHAYQIIRLLHERLPEKLTVKRVPSKKTKRFVYSYGVKSD